MATKMTALALTAALAVASQALAAPKIVVHAIYNEAAPGAAFTPSDPLGSILNTPLYETAARCGAVGNCTYDFTFALTGIPAGSSTQVQLEAAFQMGFNSTPEPLDFYLFSGTPGATPTPITSPDFISASTPVGTVGQIINSGLGNGTYYVEVLPAAVAVSGEIGSGSLTELPVPEPAAWALMLIGFGGLGVALRRNRRALAIG